MITHVLVAGGIGWAMAMLFLWLWRSEARRSGALREEISWTRRMISDLERRLRVMSLEIEERMRIVKSMENYKALLEAAKSGRKVDWYTGKVVDDSVGKTEGGDAK